MKKVSFRVSMVLLFMALNPCLLSQNLLKNSQFSKDTGWRIGLNEAATKTGGSAEFINGKAEIEHPDSSIKKYDIQLCNDVNFEIGKKYSLQFKAETTAPAVLEIVYGTKQPPYKTYCRTWVKLLPKKKNYNILLDIKKNAKGSYEPERTRSFRLYFGANQAMKMTVSDISVVQVKTLGLNKNWQLFLGVKPPTSYDKVPDFLNSKYGQQRIKMKSITLTQNCINLGELTKDAFEVGNAAILYNKFYCESPGLMQIGMAADWWFEAYVNGKKEYSTLKSGNQFYTYLPSDHVFTFPVKKGENLLAVKVLSGSKGWKFVCGQPAPYKKMPERPTIKFSEDSDWKAVDLSSIQVKEGSILDLSSLIDAPAGKHGRLIVNKEGLLAFEDDPAKSIRLRGFNGVPRNIWQYFSEETFEERATLFAKLVKRQGYAILRTNMLDCSLCYDVKTDMTINPKFLRRWDFLISKLKEEGIYIHLVLASYGLYYSPFSFKSKVFKERNEHKLRMFLGAESERVHCKYGIETLLNHVNPYTGLAWKDDPAIAVVELYNEQENGPRKIPQIIEARPDIRALVKKRWRSWLQKKFEEQPNQELIKELNGIALTNAPIPDMHGGLAELANHFSLFIGDLAVENAVWLENIVRGTGYPGLITQYNFSKKLVFSAARWQVAQVVETNGYFCHPHNNQVDQVSSVAKSANYWRSINSTRLAGRPFLVTEFNHAFWNSYQYECGLLFGAYSAFQNYSSIMIHSGPTELKAIKKGLREFTCASSPVIRAGEFLAGCLFQRRDVKQAKNSINLSISNRFLKVDSNGNKPVNSSQSKLALMTGFGLIFPDLPKPEGIPKQIPAAAMTLNPAQGGRIGGTEWATSVLDSNDNYFSLPGYVKQLKQNNILPANNISDPTKEIYQSDTGEIIMRAKEKLLKVMTPRTEAVSIQADKSETLDNLRINNSTIPATIALCSMDNKSLATSSKMVLIYSSEVANSGMELSYDRKRLIKPGAMPILMKTGQLSISLHNTNSDKLSLYALNFDGTRREKLPIKSNNGNLQITLDTKTLKNGPTPFFELSTE